MTGSREAGEAVAGSDLARRLLAVLIELIETLREGLLAVCGTLPLL